MEINWGTCYFCWFRDKFLFCQSSLCWIEKHLIPKFVTLRCLFFFGFFNLSSRHNRSFSERGKINITCLYPALRCIGSWKKKKRNLKRISLFQLCREWIIYKRLWFFDEVENIHQNYMKFIDFIINFILGIELFLYESPFFSMRLFEVKKLESIIKDAEARVVIGFPLSL